MDKRTPFCKEHILIRRWEDMVDMFGSPELVNQLIEEWLHWLQAHHEVDRTRTAQKVDTVQDEPSILRWPRRTARNALHLLSIYLGEEAQTAGHAKKSASRLHGLPGCEGSRFRVPVFAHQKLQANAGNAPGADQCVGIPECSER